jgi:hypothetical protein
MRLILQAQYRISSASNPDEPELNLQQTRCQIPVDHYDQEDEIYHLFLFRPGLTDALADQKNPSCAIGLALWVDKEGG